MIYQDIAVFDLALPLWHVMNEYHFPKQQLMEFGIFVKGERLKISHEQSERRIFLAQRVKRPLTDMKYEVTFVSEKRKNYHIID